MSRRTSAMQLREARQRRACSLEAAGRLLTVVRKRWLQILQRKAILQHCVAAVAATIVGGCFIVRTVPHDLHRLLADVDGAGAHEERAVDVVRKRSIGERSVVSLHAAAERLDLHTLLSPE